MEHTHSQGTVADAQRGNWVDRFAPAATKPYLRLARLDRPIGFWLLFWPCAFSLGLVVVARPNIDFNYLSALYFLVGAIVMRGAGCTLNDIVDRDIDDKVARTRSRPIPSGQVKAWQAAAFLAVQLLIGLVILLQFNTYTIWLGVASLGLVVIYPFMKRITWWPQLFLGLAFSWGALMGWASEFGQLYQPAILLYIGSILWTIGYDTIYALQDVEDDTMIGVKSTARLFGSHAKTIISLFYAAAFAFWLWAGLSASGDKVLLIASIPTALLLIWQVVTLEPGDGANCLKRFKANHWVGLALTLAFWLEFQF
jgi:4-hydroxybenzoate polyprenyltransferase